MCDCGCRLGVHPTSCTVLLLLLLTGGDGIEDTKQTPIIVAEKPSPVAIVLCRVVKIIEGCERASPVKQCKNST